MMKVFKSGIITVFVGFFRRELRSRMFEIVFTQDFALAVIGALALAIWGPNHFGNAAKVSDLASIIVSYGAIAIGFCIGGLTIALTLPDRDFTQRLAELSLPSKEGNALSSLLFVFSWTAVVHWLAVGAMLIVLLLSGKNDQSFLTVSTDWHRLLIAAVSFICIYSLFQFVITVLTLARVGALYIDKLRIDLKNAKESPKQPCGCGKADH
jgi:hypothetical protein